MRLDELDWEDCIADDRWDKAELIPEVTIYRAKMCIGDSYKPGMFCLYDHRPTSKQIEYEGLGAMEAQCLVIELLSGVTNAAR